jgi:hypothetical protein
MSRVRVFPLEGGKGLVLGVLPLLEKLIDPVREVLSRARPGCPSQLSLYNVEEIGVGIV